MASPAAGHLLANGTGHVKKCGYLRKQKHGHKRFFVLKEQSDGFPARLEYYESEKKWRNKSAAKRVIALDSCLNINKRADAKHKHLIALYTKDEYFAVAADHEEEQESWYRLLTDLMIEGKVCDGSASNSASSLGYIEESNYGMLTPASAAYKEVWQVNLKSKGLGQSKNLTGVYRLCLSSRTISFVKLNSEVASVVLQLMNIRRCGHSDSFFFIEVGRSASTGPGELWMQADDSVVAQNIHETILEAMKAMKELSEFRPRSKSQSSGTNPISVPTRRHLNNLPPSQTGLLRRSRTDSMAATSPVSKFTSCRIRTASEGDGTMTRPVSVNGSPISPCASRNPLNRSNTLTSRPVRRFDTFVLQHSKSMSMPVSHSPPLGTSPVSLSPSSGNGSASETLHRPSSGCASVSGSPSDAGFMSCDEYGSSPGDIKQYLAHRSNTPESTVDTPPSQDGTDLDGYMTMERPHFDLIWRKSGDEMLDLDKAYRKRTYSLTTPSQQRAPSQASSASLDEYTLMRATCTNLNSLPGSQTASPKVAYPEDYVDVEIGSLRSSSSNLGDDGYMPMTPGVGTSLGGKGENYMPMSPMTVSAPKQIINPRSHPLLAGGAADRLTSPSSCSLEDSGYMRMWCSSKLSMDSSGGEYMNMFPVDPCHQPTPPDYFHSPLPSYCFSSLPRSQKLQAVQNGDSDQYVVMSPQGQKIDEEAVAIQVNPSPIRQSRGENGILRGRVSRPTRLSLDTVRTMPVMNEYPVPSEPRSPGEYINLDFNEPLRHSSSSSSTGSPTSPLGSGNGERRSPLSDYMNVCPANLGVLPSCPLLPDTERRSGRAGPVPEDNYTVMLFNTGRDATKPQLQAAECASISSTSNSIQRLTLTDQESFLVPTLPPDPDRGAKVIRADLHGRRRHSSETFSSTTTVTPVFPSFAHSARRHGSASLENVSIWNGEGSEDEHGSPMCRETSAGFQNGLNYIALNLMDDNAVTCKELVKLRAGSHCKGSVNGILGVPYVSLAFKETTAAAVKD